MYALLNSNSRIYKGAKIMPLKGQPNTSKVVLDIGQPDLKRFSEVSSQATYLLEKKDDGTISSMLLDTVPTEPAAGKILLAETWEPKNGEVCVRFKKGEDPKAGDKELYIEVWRADQGFVSSLKVNDKLAKVYNDTVFGGLSWSPDGKRIIFIGEVPPVEKFTPFFKDESDEKKADEGKKSDEHFQDEKFLYKEHFGETLSDKQDPAIYIFDTEANKL